MLIVTAKLKDCFVDDMEWLATRFHWLRQSYHFETNFDRVLLHLVDILNTSFKYWVSYRQLTFIIETFFELSLKSCAKFDLLFVNIQWLTACSFEKLNFEVLTAEPHKLFQ